MCRFTLSEIKVRSNLPGNKIFDIFSVISSHCVNDGKASLN